MTTITAYCSVKNGVEFIEAWLENTRPADAVVIQDGGSTDGTVELLLEEFRENPERTTLLLQKETEEKFKWNEQIVRNQMLGIFKTDWILLQDVDELVEDRFWKWFKETDHNENVEKKGYYIAHKNLWLDKSIFRIGPPWYPDLGLRLFKNHRGFYWVGKEHASLYAMDGMCSPQDPGTPVAVCEGEPIHFIHYHRFEAGYYNAVMNDETLHHSNEKQNLNEPIIRTRLREHPTGAGLIRKRFEKQ